MKTGIVLLNMGGPDSPEAVRPFLRNLFADNDLIQLPGGRIFQSLFARLISTLRAPSVRENYARIGGSSPIRQITEAQAQALTTWLSENQHGEVLTYIAMRYWHPRAREVVAKLQREGIPRLILLSLYPHYAGATSGSSLREFQAELKRAGWCGQHHTIDRWYDFPPYIDSLEKKVREGLQTYSEPDRKNVLVLFSAHSLPQAQIDRGDTYVRHIEATVQAVVARFDPQPPYRLSYQSQVGPIRWVGPRTDEVLEEFGREGKKDVLVVPLSFVSDHIETLYEVDLLFGEVARKAGLTGYRRTESLNTDPLFIEALGKLVTPHLAHG